MNSFIVFLVLVSFLWQAKAACPNTSVLGQDCEGNGKPGKCQSTCGSTSSSDFVSRSGCCDGLPNEVKCCTVLGGSNPPTTNANCPNAAVNGQKCQANGRVGTCSSTCSLTDAANHVSRSGCCDGLPSAVKCCLASTTPPSNACSSFNPTGTCSGGLVCTNGSCQSAPDPNCPNNAQQGQKCLANGRVGVCSDTCSDTSSTQFVARTGCCDNLPSTTKCCLVSTTPSTVCSLSNKSGTCSQSGTYCRDGVCVPTDTGCSPSNPNGPCSAGNTCQGGQCKPPVTTDCPNAMVVGQRCQGNGKVGVCSSSCSLTDSANFVARSGCCDGLPTEVKCCVASPTSSVCSATNPTGTCSRSGTYCQNGVCVDTNSGCDPMTNPTGTCSNGFVCMQGFCRPPSTACPNNQQVGQVCTSMGRTGTCSSSCAQTDSSNFVARSGCCDGLPTEVKCCLAGAPSSTACSPTNHSGTCTGSNYCSDGVCVPTSSGCSLSNPNGACSGGNTCQGGQCRPPVSTDEDCPNRQVQGQKCKVASRVGVCSSSCAQTDSTNFVSRSGCCDGLPNEVKCCLVGTASSTACSASNQTGSCSQANSYCRDGVCVPTESGCSPTNPNGPCSAGNVCEAGRCVSPSTCSATNRVGTCTGDRYCRDGVCELTSSGCDPSNPNGACSGNNYCLDGKCVPTFTGCSPENPTGPCSGGNVCDGGQCKPSTSCSATNKNGFCAGSQYCRDGVCVDTNSGCSPTNPFGPCSNGLTCDNGQCRSVSATCPNRSVVGQACLGNGRVGSCLEASRCSVANDPNQFIAKTGCCDGLVSSIKCCAPAPNVDPVSNNNNNVDAQCPNQQREGQACRAEGITGGTCTSVCSGANRKAVPRSGCCDGLASDIQCCIPLAETIQQPGNTPDVAVVGVGSTLCTTTSGVIVRGGPCKTSTKLRTASTTEKVRACCAALTFGVQFTQLAAAVPSTCSDGYQWVKVKDASNAEGYLTTALTKGDCSSAAAAADTGGSVDLGTSKCSSVGAFNLPAPTSLTGKRRFYATRYIKPTGSQLAGGYAVKLFPSGTTIATVSKTFWCELHLQGSGVITGVGLVTFAKTTSGCVSGCAHKKKSGGCQSYFQFTKSSSPYGEGTYFQSSTGTSTSCWLAPFRSLASDRSIPPGTMVYIPEARGQSFTHAGETRTHDGWHMVCDRGSKITGNKFDYFSGANHNNVPMPFVRSTSSRQFDAYLYSSSAAPSQVRNFLLRLHDARFRCGGVALLQDADLIDESAVDSSASDTEGGMAASTVAAIVVSVLVCAALVCVGAFCVFQLSFGAPRGAAAGANGSGKRGHGRFSHASNDAGSALSQSNVPTGVMGDFVLPPLHTPTELMRPNRQNEFAGGFDTLAAFACTLCEKRYDYADDLQQHMQLRHPHGSNGS